MQTSFILAHNRKFFCIHGQTVGLCVAINAAYFTFIIQKALIKEIGEMKGLFYKTAYGHDLLCSSARLAYDNTEYTQARVFPSACATYRLVVGDKGPKLRRS
jgi:hypothetical protein